MDNCEHKFAYLETRKRRTHHRTGYNYFKKVDVFYCEKCLEYREKVTEDHSMEVPEWFKD